MPDYKVSFTERSLDDLNDLPDAVFERIRKACKRLESNPVPDGKHIKKLRGYQELYRLRIGDYRAVFQWTGNTITIIIIRILSKPDFQKKY